MGAMATRTHGNAATAPTVADHHKGSACQQDVGGANDAVEGALAGAVAVVEQMLGHGIIHRHHRIAECAIRRHGTQTDHPGSGLLGSA